MRLGDFGTPLGNALPLLVLAQHDDAFIPSLVDCLVAGFLVAGGIVIGAEQLLGNCGNNESGVEGFVLASDGITELVQLVAGDAFLIVHQFSPSCTTHTATAGHSKEQNFLGVNHHWTGAKSVTGIDGGDCVCDNLLHKADGIS